MIHRTLYVRLKNEKIKRDLNKVSFKVPDFSTECFKEQWDFIRDVSRRIVAMCSRRAGKSTAVSYLLLATALSGNKYDCLYITRTIERARNILWKPLNDIIRDHKIPCSINNTNYTIYFPLTRSTIYLMGINDASSVDRPLGMFVKLAVIDEAQSFPPYLKDLCKRVLSACLTDLQGKMVLIGTPNPACAGYFHELYEGGYYSKHNWTWRENHFYIEKAMKENSSLTCAEDIFKDILEEFALDENDAHAQREWFGRCVKSTSLLVYEYQDKNFGDIPETTGEGWSFVVAADFGLKDAFAIVVWAFHEFSRKAYLIDQYKAKGVDAFRAGEILSEYETKYTPIASVVDGGGLGKCIAEGINRVFSTNLIYADKVRKAEHIAMYSADLRRGNIIVPLNAFCAQEAQKLFWDDEYFAKGVFRETQGQENDACDAALYGWVYLEHHRVTLPPVIVNRDSNEWAEQKLKELRERENGHSIWGDKEEFFSSETRSSGNGF